MMEIAERVGWWWPFQNACVVTDRPTSVGMQNGVIHCVDGPAIAYSDGFCVFGWKGIRTPVEWGAPATWTSALFSKAENVEHRRALIECLGMERLIQDLGAVTIHRAALAVGGLYELLQFELPGVGPTKHLKMINPSVGCVHIEGVPNECRTVEEALHSRKPAVMREIPVAEDGEEWRQQGDVCFWPAGAKSLQRYPAIIT